MTPLSATGSVDFNTISGKIRKRLHGSNAAPPVSTRNVTDLTDDLRSLGFTGARTHDWALTNAGLRMIDTHFVFPLMHADPADPANYYFDASDEIIDLSQSCGSDILYRLGTSIEHSRDRHFNTIPPADFEKYAEVLAGIVRHYHCGWGGGHCRNIRYWEIWNEADLHGLMWDGPRESYCRFFNVVFRRLKSEFPELMIGGPAYTHLNEEFFREFLNSCRAGGVEPDFLSWHCYTADADDLIDQPRRARKLFDEMGFQRSELMINEWHYLLSWEGIRANPTPEGYQETVLGPTGMHGIDSAAFNLAVLAGWHDTPLDSAFYYGVGGNRSDWSFYDICKAKTRNFHAMKLFGDFIAAVDDRVEAVSESKSLYLLGGLSPDRRTGRLLAVDYRGEGKSIRLRGMENVRITGCECLDADRNLDPAEVRREGDDLILGKASAGSAAFLLSMEFA